jgi:hypothetical protein
MTIKKTSGLIDGDDQSLLGTGQLVSRTLLRFTRSLEKRAMHCQQEDGFDERMSGTKAKAR